MGTRHKQTVITKEGDYKIKQYGQWDGYPSGQGVEILKYLRTGNLKKYQEELAKINLITDGQIKEVEADPNWTTIYPYLSRNCGSNIHQLIEDGKVKFVSHVKECDWCEGFYTIDFKNHTFTAEYRDITRSWSLDDLPTDKQFLKDMADPYTNEEE